MGARFGQRRPGRPAPGEDVQTDLYTRLENDARRLVERVAAPAPAWCQCVHGWLLGYVMRPWTGSPNCPACRRYPKRWLSPEETAYVISTTPAKPALSPANAPGLFPVIDLVLKDGYL